MQTSNAVAVFGAGSDRRNGNGRGITDQNDVICASLIKTLKKLALDLKVFNGGLNHKVAMK